MKRTALIPALALVSAGAAAAALPMLYEEQLARAEERLILVHPIAGIENELWFDYRINVTEAQKELNDDIYGEGDVEDLREAWEDYADELQEDRIDYVEAMAERGYRMGVVIVGD